VDEELGGIVGFDVILEVPDGILDPDVLARLRALEDRIAGVTGVRTLVGPGRLLEGASEATGIPIDGPAGSRVVLAAIHAAGGGDLVRRFVGPDARSARILALTGDVGSIRSASIRGQVAPLLQDLPEGVEARIAGLTVMAETVLERFVAQMARSTTLALVVIFVLMTAIFRSFRIGALSMVPNVLPLLVAAGFMGFAGITIRSSITLVFAVALGIAVDDTIHVLCRYRLETRRGAGPADAVVAAIRWTGRPVLLSSVLLVAGFLTNVTATFKATQQFGLVAAVTIAVALVGDLIVLPALLLLRARPARE
jgi:predicted RND superfamily exporter protein